MLSGGHRVKIIVGQHINGSDKRPRLWRVPEPLMTVPVIEYETRALVDTQKGYQRVKILKIMETDEEKILDKKTDSYISIQKMKDVLKFYQ